MREKERGGTLLSFYHTCSSKYHHVLHIESFHILLVGSLHYRTWLLYFDDDLHQMLEVMSKQVGCTPTQLHQESFHTYSSSASIAWQFLLLTLTQIVRPLHCLTINRVDVRLSYIFVFPYKPQSSLSLPLVVLNPRLTLMY